MPHDRTVRRRLFLAVAFAGVALCAACLLVWTSGWRVAFHPKPRITPDMEALFRQEIGSTTSAQLNDGLTISRLDDAMFLLYNVHNQDPNSMAIRVHNSSAEAIEAPNIDFGLHIFWFDHDNRIWREYFPAYYPDQQIVTLEPGSNSGALKTPYYVILDGLVFSKSPTNAVRLVMFGRGVQTGIVYIATLDTYLSR